VLRFFYILLVTPWCRTFTEFPLIIHYYLLIRYIISSLSFSGFFCCMYCLWQPHSSMYVYRIRWSIGGSFWAPHACWDQFPLFPPWSSPHLLCLLQLFIMDSVVSLLNSVIVKIYYCTLICYYNWMCWIKYTDQFLHKFRGNSFHLQQTYRN
jgi:hypothetical protein